ncbi:hypothetical protein PF005_g12086 [Phytophthora fragariae]|uniref:Anaphase-promoting complex subunit 11 RING-H2 finger domain-containing protein n=1 Tax=Phytophthora fragariae TaxID=53985 RepID=A0A6A3KRF0_9STRA|nr:hypothetical protein PF003_g10427 [Phytophthora fragariae]KAE8936815.1 hypothetical protein PF009_g13269 [Phytophthora fragariae]KAE9007805.1 hypothetical protein PF011_g10972 [Phytophthora fragariae]KAE9086642.1 hypothetical protein PF010_g20010 [Phytophthora fragariae]KAE9109219.1 hypothetical protein PF007_g12329 [Phytophthora fragariae]
MWWSPISILVQYKWMLKCTFLCPQKWYLWFCPRCEPAFRLCIPIIRIHPMRTECAI